MITGIARVVRFNAPWYLLSLVVIAAAGVVAFAGSGTWRWTAGAGAIVAAWFTLASIIASWDAYDRRLGNDRWLAASVGGTPGSVVVVHAGLDLASAAAARCWPTAAVRVLDIFAATSMPASSIARARAIEAPRGEAATFDRLPIADASCDLIIAMLALHELRRADRIAAFTIEARRALRAGGRLVVVEHLRDAANIAAYGPGAWHFLPRARWHEAFAASGGALAIDEARLGAWLRIFTLRPRAEREAIAD